MWKLDLATGRQRRLTRARKGLAFFPSSFSPDGSALALTRIDENLGFDAVVLWLTNGNVELLAAEAHEPMFSPDGSKIALIREYFRGPSLEETTDVYLLERGRFPLRRLTRTPRTSESSPSWDPSGSRLAYVRAQSSGSSLATQFGLGSAVMEINSDGSCPRKLVSYPRSVVYGTAWQPGPGRGAGRISC